GHNFTSLEKRISQILQNQPNKTFKEIADQVGLSQKAITQIVKKLREKQIKIGALISYSAVGLSEYFIETEDFNRSVFNNVFIYLENNVLFPNNKKLYYGISKRKIKSDNYYEVLDKKYSINLSLIQEPYTLKWSLSQNKPRSRSQIIYAIKNHLTTKKTGLKPHTIMLLRNCEKDFKKPEYQQISKKCKVSIRTLLREKSKLVKNEIIKPCLDTDIKMLMYLFVKSNVELSKLYDFLPIMKSFKVSNKDKNILWISKIGILPSDLPTLLNYLHDWADISIINSRQVIIDKTLELKCY
ncbi:MAG: winged helix-turn-helix transcriptional regulator, partial [Candidatus Heimdallarchaeaceae archaeon]